MTTRRQFLSRSAAAFGLSALAPWQWPDWARAAASDDPTAAAPKTPPTLVIVYLRGGADPLHTIIPYGERDYRAIRPTLAVPTPPRGWRPGQPTGGACIPIDRMFAFHPALEPLYELYREGWVAPIINVGSKHETRSHFDAQDFMEWAAPGIKSVQEGWLNRYLQATSTSGDHFLRAYSPQALLPRSLRGSYSVLAAPGPGSKSALGAFGELYEPCDEGAQVLERLLRPPVVAGPDGAEKSEDSEDSSSGDERKKRRKRPLNLGPARDPVTGRDTEALVQHAGAETIAKLGQLNEALEKAKSPGKRGYPGGELARQLADIASVVRAGLPIEITAVDYGGWDLHSYQGGAEGQMASRLGNLASSLRAFVRDLGPERMQNVVVLTMTEFGRTVRENGTQGTDHGHGGFMLAIGGRVRGGQVYGKWTGFGQRDLYRGRDLPVHTDFRDVFAEVLLKLYRFDAREHPFFPEYENPLSAPLEFLG